MSQTLVGVVGAGNVGRQFVDFLADEPRYERVVYDVDPDRLEDCVATGASAATSPADLAGRVDVTVLCLPGHQYVEAAMEGPDGVLDGLAAGDVVIDTGTTRPDVDVHYARECQERGATLLDVPLTWFDYDPETDTPEFAMFAGGPRETYGAVVGLLDVLSVRHRHFGPVGSGQVAKTAQRMKSTLEKAANAELVEYLRNNGVDPAALEAFLEWDFDSTYFEDEYDDAPGFRAAMGASGRDDEVEDPELPVDDTGARTELATPGWLKDPFYALEVAHASDTAVPLLAAAVQALQATSTYADAVADASMGFQEGWDHRDVVSYYRRLNRPREEWGRLRRGADWSGGEQD